VKIIPKAAGLAAPDRQDQRRGIYADSPSVEEGRLYHLNKMNFVGVKLFRTPKCS